MTREQIEAEFDKYNDWNNDIIIDFALHIAKLEREKLLAEIDEIPNLNNDSMWKAHVMFTLDKYRGGKNG